MQTVSKDDAVSLLARDRHWVSIGTGPGEDFFLDYCALKKPANILCAEPIEQYLESYQTLCQRYRLSITTERVAIVDDPLLEQVVLFTPGGGFGKGHHSVVGHKDWDYSYKVTCPCCTINTLLDKHGVMGLSLLVIDTEGNDARIINSLDFEKHPTDVLIFENWAFSTDYFREENPLYGKPGIDLIIAKLQSMGYNIDQFIDDSNYIAYKRDI